MPPPLVQPEGMRMSPVAAASVPLPPSVGRHRPSVQVSLAGQSGFSTVHV